MSIPLAYYISAIVLTTLWAIILVRALNQRMLARYPFFYCYAGAFAFLYHLKLIAKPLLDNYSYAELYFWSDVVVGLLEIGLLIQIFRLGSNGKASRWLPVAFLAAVTFGVTSIESEAYSYVRILNAFYVSVCALVAMNLTRLRQVILGSNCYAILGGILLIRALGALNYMAYLSGLRWWPSDTFRHAVEPAILAAWILMAAGLWRYDPPRQKETVKCSL